MKRNVLTYFITLLFPLLILAGSVSADFSIKGTLGVDLDVIGYSSRSHDNRYPAYDVTRYISGHYLSLGNSGYIKSDEFASYSIFTKLKGNYSSTNTGLLRKSFYSSPNINSFNGDITLFPKRTYPLRFYYASINDVSLIVRESNRTKTELLTPGLALVQKSRIDVKKYGSTFKASVIKDVDLNVDYSSSESMDSYEYDFDENRAVTIELIELPGDIVSPTVKVFIRNNIVDDSLRIVSGLIDVIIPAQFSVDIFFDPGQHEIQVIPMNSYRQEVITVNFEQGKFYRLEIDPDKFPSSTDNLRKNSITKFGLDLTKKKYQISTTYSIENEEMETFGLLKKANFFANLLKVDLSRKLSVGVRTSQNKNESSKGEGQPQILNDFNNRSMISYQQTRGLSATVEHEYKKNNFNDQAGTDDNLLSNIFSSKITLPLKKFNQVIMLDNVYGIFEQTGQVSSSTTQTGFKLSNRMEIASKFGRFTPLTDLTINSNSVSTDSLTLESDEFSFNSSLNFERPNDRLLGNISSTAGFTYQKTADNIKTNITNTINYGVLISKEISDKQKIAFNTNHNWKSYGGSLKETADTLNQSIIELKAPEYSGMYSVTFTSTKWNNFLFSTNYSLGISPGTRRTNFGLQITTLIPFIKLPLTTEIKKENTSIPNLPTQSRLDAETVISYTFSKINIKLSHLYEKEVLVRDTYVFYQINVSITRSL